MRLAACAVIRVGLVLLQIRLPGNSTARLFLFLFSRTVG